MSQPSGQSAPADEAPPSPRKPDPGGCLEDPRIIHPSPEGVFDDPVETVREEPQQQCCPEEPTGESVTEAGGQSIIDPRNYQIGPEI